MMRYAHSRLKTLSLIAACFLSSASWLRAEEGGAPKRTYAFGSLVQASPELLLSQLEGLGLVEKDRVGGRLSLTARGRESKIVLLGGQFASSSWLDYLRLIDQLDPNFGKANANILALASSRDVEAIADSVYEMDRSSRFDVTQLVDALSLSQRVVRVGQQIFTSESISSLAESGEDLIKETNVQLVSMADSLRSQMARPAKERLDFKPLFGKDQAIDEALISTALLRTGATSIISGAAGTRGLDLKALHSLAGAQGQLIVYEATLAKGRAEVREVAVQKAMASSVPALDLGGFQSRSIPRPALSRRTVCVASFAFAGVLLGTGAYAQMSALQPAPPDMPFEQACKATGGILPTLMPVTCYCAQKTPPYYDPFVDICG